MKAIGREELVPTSNGNSLIKVHAHDDYSGTSYSAVIAPLAMGIVLIGIYESQVTPQSQPSGTHQLGEKTCCLPDCPQTRYYGVLPFVIKRAEDMTN